jgi:GTP 3',8-cyclase
MTTVISNREIAPKPAYNAVRIPRWAKKATSIASAWGFMPYLRVSVTGECNANCRFCHNEGNSRHASGLTIEEYRQLARDASEIGINTVKLSGGEPCTRADLPEIVREFHDAGFNDISLITNGSLLWQDLQYRLKSAGLQRVTVSIHTLKPDRFERLMRMGSDALGATMENLKTMVRVFPRKLKLNCVFIDGTNFPDEVVPLVRYTCSLGATLSVLSILRPNHRGAELSTAVRRLVEQNFEMLHIYTTKKRLVDVKTLVLKDGGAVELDDFRLEQAVAIKNTNPYCAGCLLRQVCTEGPYAFRLTANGRFKPCLIRRDNEVPISSQ